MTKKVIDACSIILLSLLAIQLIVNSIGALGPEYAFDAVWYHLTLPKIYLLSHSIEFIPGGLFYYSVMPKLGEMFYIAALSIQGAEMAKIFHLSFGLLSLVALYKTTRVFYERNTALLAVVIFYANIVVAWESTTAYIDLIRTFYEILAFFAFLKYSKHRKMRFLYLSALMTGFAIATKMIAFTSIGIYAVLLLWMYHKTVKVFLTTVCVYICLSIFIPLPWFLLAYFSTGNPLYPLFSGYKADVSIDLLSPLMFMKDSINLLLFAEDPINPVYLMALPLVFLLRKNMTNEIKLVSLYALFSFLLWYVTPRTGGGRFILPYLPVWSILVVYMYEQLKKTYFLTAKAFFIICILIAISTILYRGITNSKYVAVLLGKETRSTFLSNHLNFSFGDFYDTDGFFERTITEKDKVLLYGFHNLFYVNFPFIDASYLKKGDRFNYIAVQEGKLPDRFSHWKKIYSNTITNVKVYTNDKKYESY